jgi:hypothetical protein
MGENFSLSTYFIDSLAKEALELFNSSFFILESSEPSCMELFFLSFSMS